MKQFFLVTAITILSLTAHANSPSVRGMNLTEIGAMKYDAEADPSKPKKPAQLAVDELKTLGVTQVLLNPRATMTDPRGNDVIPMTPVAERADERLRYKRLIDYIHSQGMTVGIRPIFFVVDSQGRTPYVEILPNGQKKIWWHGNIQPQNPNLWFDSFKRFLDVYLLIAKGTNAEEFTIGSELYSMTVGIEDQWKENPYGFPKQWVDLLKYTRGKLGSSTRIMYDINFTDDKVNAGGLGTTGGELERWRYRLVDLAPPTDPAKRAAWEADPAQGPIWKELSQFWLGLDAVGVDMYRSLASGADVLPTDYNGLVAKLQVKAEEYATQLDSILAEVEMTLGSPKTIIFKEVGYRSTTKGFVDPFVYDNKLNDVNIPHQAAAYEAFFNAFWKPNWAWFGGVNFWDVSVDPQRKGTMDPGFSPLEKKQTADLIRIFFKGP